MKKIESTPAMLLAGTILTSARALLMGTERGDAREDLINQTQAVEEAVKAMYNHLADEGRKAMAA